jgi:hypothetical protein
VHTEKKRTTIRPTGCGKGYVSNDATLMRVHALKDLQPIFNPLHANRRASKRRSKGASNLDVRSRREKDYARNR